MSLDFCKVLRTISSSSGAPGFCPFQFFIIPMYRAITKNTCESTCGKSSMSHVEHAKQIITGMTKFQQFRRSRTLWSQ